MAIDYSVLALPKHKPAVLARHEKKTTKQAGLDAAYADVDKRDKKRCQVRGTPLTAGHVDEWRRLTRDHLGPRSTYPEDRANPDNILTASAGAHALLQSGALIPVDKKGQETRRVSQIAGYVWGPSVKTPPFRLKAMKARG